MKKKITIFTALIALPIIAATTGESLAAKVCKGYVTGRESIPTPTKGLAEADAEVRWGTRVTQTYSLQWSNWQNASGKNHYCKKTTSVIGANVWRCRARAKPCIFQ